MSAHSVRSAAFALALGAMLGGCARGYAAFPNAHWSNVAAAATVSLPLTGPGNPGRIYVVQGQVFNVIYFPLHGHDQKYIDHITGFFRPEEIAVDSHGALYVPELDYQDVQIYQRPRQHPQTVQDPGQFPYSVAVSKNGTIYVGNITSATYPIAVGSISVYPPSQSQPHTLTDQNFFNVGQMALDSHDNLFVSYVDAEYVRHIAEFLNGSGPPQELGTFAEEAFTLDRDDNIVVGARNELDVYRPNSHGRFKRIAVNGWPSSLAFSQDGDYLFFVNSTTNTVDVCTYPGGKLVDSISNGLGGGNFPTALAVYPTLPH